MPLKLQLVKNGEILFEMPLAVKNWPKKELIKELDKLEEDLDDFSLFFDALSNEVRLRMMKRLMEEEDHTVNFADFMHDLDLNPKIVWENTRKLRDGGLLVKVDRGRYRCSEVGQRRFILLSLAFRRLMDALEEFSES